MPLIYHITTPNDWQLALTAGQYTHPSLATEGFIHCSTYAQVPRTIQKHFASETGLILLQIDTTNLTAELIYENTSGGTEPFPHVYGAIILNAVAKLIDWDEDGWSNIS